MSWKLFIDDIRNPVTDDWVICRSSREAKIKVNKLGFPNEIAFDHDLGGDDTVMNFIYWLEGQLVDGNLTIPRDFTYSVHSSNPVGALNIRAEMTHMIFHFGPENDS